MQAKVKPCATGRSATCLGESATAPMTTVFGEGSKRSSTDERANPAGSDSVRQFSATIQESVRLGGTAAGAHADGAGEWCGEIGRDIMGARRDEMQTGHRAGNRQRRRDKEGRLTRVERAGRRRGERRLGAGLEFGRSYGHGALMDSVATAAGGQARFVARPENRCERAEGEEQNQQNGQTAPHRLYATRDSGEPLVVRQPGFFSQRALR